MANINSMRIAIDISVDGFEHDDARPAELIEGGRRRVPLGRVGCPDDVVGLAAFLLSADAVYMTGQGVAINGGTMLVP